MKPWTHHRARVTPEFVQTVRALAKVGFAAATISLAYGYARGLCENIATRATWWKLKPEPAPLPSLTREQAFTLRLHIRLRRYGWVFRQHRPAILAYADQLAAQLAPQPERAALAAELIKMWRSEPGLYHGLRQRRAAA